MRPADPIVVCQYDIVITTLSVVLESVKRTNDPLRSIRFFRIILDEAHDIRTTTSKRFNAVCALSGERKWALTGTPIQNRMEDLAALFGFIGYSPLGTPALMQEMLRDDDSQGLSGLEKLRGALGILCLRRSHAIVNLDLPKREETVVAIPFSPDERQFYDQIAGTGQKVVTHLLNPLTRIHHLRMICNYGCELPEKASGPDAAAAKCSLCKQTGDSVNQLEGSGCPHRQLCALCIEDIRVIGLGECSVCAMEEVTTPDAMDIDFEPAGHGQTFTYLGQSTKVRELIKNIFSDMNAADRPKQYEF